MTNYDLYSGVPPHSDGDTSRQAAEEIQPHVSRLASDVLQYVLEHGGATCWEVEKGLKMSHQTASARIRELALKNQLVRSQLKRPTASGRAAVVWVGVDSRCEHTIEVPGGSWELRGDKYECGVCGKFYGYVKRDKR